MDWLASRREIALQQAQPQTNSLAKLRRSSIVPPSSSVVKTANTSQRRPGPNFLNLPSELRNLIYINLFQSEAQRIKSTYELPGLLLANRQIHFEAIGLYYSLSTFRCLEEDATVSWLVHLPKAYFELVKEVKYDTRWITFTTPLIPMPGSECWLVQKLCDRLKGRGFDVDSLGGVVTKGVGDEIVVGEGKLKVSFYERGPGGCGGIVWTDKPGLIDAVREAGQ